MIGSCLVKDPHKRPTPKRLLKHSFFKQARSNEYITRKLLDGLPGLGDRMKQLKVNWSPLIEIPLTICLYADLHYILWLLGLVYTQEKEEDMLAQKKMPDGEKEELSQVSMFVSFNF